MSDPNTVVFLAMNAAAAALPDAFWANVTLLGDSLVVLALLSILAVRYPQALPAGLLAGLLATFVTRTLKALLGMERPLAVLGEQVHVIGINLYHFSFPSGHTTAAFLLAGIATFSVQRKGIGWVLFSLAALVGLSRIAVGAHWPLDVLVAAACGWMSAWLGWKTAKRWQWPDSLVGRRVFAGIFLLFSLLLFTLDSGYPQALGLQMAIASLASLAGLITLWNTWRYR